MPFLNPFFVMFIRYTHNIVIVRYGLKEDDYKTRNTNTTKKENCNERPLQVRLIMGNYSTMISIKGTYTDEQILRTQPRVEGTYMQYELISLHHFAESFFPPVMFKLVGAYHVFPTNGI